MLAMFTHLTSSMPFSFFPLTLYTVGLYGRPSFVHSIFPIFLTSGSASSILGLPFALSGQSIKKTVDILPRLFWKTSDCCILCANSRIEIATYEHHCNYIYNQHSRENLFAIVFVFIDMIYIFKSYLVVSSSNSPKSVTMPSLRQNYPLGGAYSIEPLLKMHI